MPTQLQFTRPYTQIIKGVAILFMLFLHVGGSDSAWLAPMVTLDDMSLTASWHPSFVLCVGIFTFMIGFGYGFCRDKNLTYALQHIWRLLRVYWVVLMVFTLPVIAITGGLSALTAHGFNYIVQNFLGVCEDWNWYSWFVYLFIFAMAVMPFVGRLIDRRPVPMAIASIVFFYVCEAVIHQFVPCWDTNHWVHALFACCELMPTIILGYLFCRKGWFIRISLPRHWLVAVAALLLIVLTFTLHSHWGSIMGFSLYFFYAPMVIFAILAIFNLYELPLLRRCLTALGDASVWMWFLHSLFFLPGTRHFYQPLISWSGNIWLAILSAIIITYLAARILMCLESNLISKK